MTRAQAVLLAAVIAVAVALRAIGLGWGLRHPPHPDEGAFVENVHRMIAAGDLDHRYYEYPGLFFYALYPVLRPLMGDEPPGPGSYLAARGVVAAWGVACVVLTFVLGRRMAGRGAGLVAAALAATSLVAVQTAHTVRPDVALSALFALALVAFTRLDGGARADLLAGAAVGAACATKFSGVFLLPALAVARLLVPERRLRGLLLAGAAAAATFVVASPYSLVHLGEFVEGVETQVSYHYEDSPDPERTTSWAGMAALYAGVWVKALGVPAALLSAAGLAAVAARAARSWLPLVVVPATAVTVLATSHVRHDRFLLPALPVAFVLAGAGAAWAVSRVPGRASVAAWAALAVLAVVPPTVTSARYLRDIARPLTADRAIDWARDRLPAGSRVLTRLELGLDHSQVEVLRVRRIAARTQVLEADYVVSTHRDDPAPLAGLEVLARFEPSGRYNGPAIAIHAVPAALRPAYEDVAIAAPAVEVSSGAATRGALADGDEATWWRTEEIQRAGDFVSVRFDGPRRVARVEMRLDGEPKFAARDPALQVAVAGAWRAVATVPGRPAPEDQHRLPRGYSQVVLLTPPVQAGGVRLVQRRNAGRRWGIAELRIQALAAEAP